MNKNIRIGILGGGQLAEMTLTAGKELGADIKCLVNHKDDPSFIYHAEQCFLPEKLVTFAKSIDVLSFESEFFNVSQLESILNSNAKIRCFPKPESIQILKNKLEQKKLFEQLSIPQADFLKLIPQYFKTRSSFEKLFTKFLSGYVLKFAHGGYDGKGNLVVRDNNEDSLQKALEFSQKAFREGVDVYAEALIPFDQELAITCFYESKTEQLKYLPLVITKQHENICKEVWGPAQDFNISSSHEDHAKKIAQKIQNLHPDLRVFAIEFFLTSDHKLLVNEIAPRVHNSGHFSQLFENQSQFHNWILSLSESSLDIPKNNKCFVMRNLIGLSNTDKLPGTNTLEPFPSLKWYGKQSINTGRKMGHWNKEVPFGADLKLELSKTREYLANEEKSFWKKLNND